MRFLFGFLFLSLFSCGNEIKTDLGKTQAYFSLLLKKNDGYVWKYYTHQRKVNSDHPTTNILYRHIKSYKGNHLIIEDYNAGYQKTYHRTVKYDNDSWKSMKEYKIFQDEYTLKKGDTLQYDIHDSILISWVDSNVEFNKSYKFNDFDVSIHDSQQMLKDSISDGLHNKVISGTRNIKSIKNNDTTLSSYHWEKQFRDGMGLYSFSSKSEQWSFDWELVEIMSKKEFDKRKNHGTHRVGFIDTTNTFKVASSFAPCGPTNRIADYYNDDDAKFIGGKGALFELLETTLDKSKPKGESGYLTFRFVVNCEGKAGWFTTEEADLDYQRKSFSSECKNHLYDILSSVEKWKMLTIRDQVRDAYVYITFKLKNGKIIEILP